MSDPITVELTLTEDEWVEVANALESKLRLVERGDYGEGDKPGDNEAWTATLQSALDVVAAALAEKKINW